MPIKFDQNWMNNVEGVIVFQLYIILVYNSVLFIQNFHRPKTSNLNNMPNLLTKYISDKAC